MKMTSMTNDKIKVNKTQRISAKVYSELDSLSEFSWLLQNLLWKKKMLWKTRMPYLKLERQSVIHRCSSK